MRKTVSVMPYDAGVQPNRWFCVDTGPEAAAAGAGRRLRPLSIADM
jgi:hypothetical protein